MLRTGCPSASPPLRLLLRLGCRDHAAWCPYCQKVWLQLEEKQLPYTIEKINMRCYGDKPRDFIAKVAARITLARRPHLAMPLTGCSH
jgi:hypothetical protein